MKGLKIENIRDPKWIGKKIIVGELSVSPDKLVFVGNGQICTENRFKSLSLWPIDCYDWYEWIEFPFKVGDKIVKKSWFRWVDESLEYIKLINISEDNFEIGTYPNLNHYYANHPNLIREDILENTSEWELYIPPKKKKTVAFGLVRYNNGTSFSNYAYETQEELKDVVGLNILQFPAVTKDGTVLEFEVDDDS